MPEYDHPALLREAVHAYVDSKRGSTLVGRAYDMSEPSSRAAYEEEVYVTVSGVLDAYNKVVLPEVWEHVRVPSAGTGSAVLGVRQELGREQGEGRVDEAAEWFARRWDVC